MIEDTLIVHAKIREALPGASFYSLGIESVVVLDKGIVFSIMRHEGQENSPWIVGIDEAQKFSKEVRDALLSILKDRYVFFENALYSVPNEIKPLLEGNGTFEKDGIKVNGLKVEHAERSNRFNEFKINVASFIQRKSGSWQTKLLLRNKCVIGYLKDNEIRLQHSVHHLNKALPFDWIIRSRPDLEDYITRTKKTLREICYGLTTLDHILSTNQKESVAECMKLDDNWYTKEEVPVYIKFNDSNEFEHILTIFVNERQCTLSDSQLIEKRYYDILKTLRYSRRLD